MVSVATTTNYEEVPDWRIEAFVTYKNDRQSRENGNLMMFNGRYLTML